MEPDDFNLIEIKYILFWLITKTTPFYNSFNGCKFKTITIEYSYSATKNNTANIKYFKLGQGNIVL